MIKPDKNLFPEWDELKKEAKKLNKELSSEPPKKLNNF